MTLVEVLAVVVLLGTIAGALLVGFSSAYGRAKHALARSGMGVIRGKLELYHMDHDAWPSNEIGLAALSDGYARPTDPHYLGADQLLDPWGNPYLYITPGPDGHPFELLTFGADGRPGGFDEDADVSSAGTRTPRP
jgi:general secretion pathway protein G